MAAEAGKDVELQAPEDAITSLAFHPSDPNRLLVSSWDASIGLYDCSAASRLRNYTPSRAPVFDVAWGPASSTKIYSGGLDRSVIETDLETSTHRVIANHDDAVKCVQYLESANCLVTASWDGTLRVHDPRSSTPANASSSLVSPLPSKAFSMDSAGDKLVVAMAQRHVCIYDHRNLSQALSSSTPPAPYQKRENSLKFMTRAVRCMPNGTGYASSSIEGRVAVEYFDQSAEVQKGHFAFKCHRQTVDGVDTVYPVNALAFHPVHGTFATGGGDSVVSIWDPIAKKRLRQLPKYSASVSSLAFNASGDRLAIASAVVEEEQGTVPPGMRNSLIVRGVGDDCKPKAKA